MEGVHLFGYVTEASFKSSEKCDFAPKGSRDTLHDIRQYLLPRGAKAEVEKN